MIETPPEGCESVTWFRFQLYMRFEIVDICAILGIACTFRGYFLIFPGERLKKLRKASIDYQEPSQKTVL